jgi:hypothetical protein
MTIMDVLKLELFEGEIKDIINVLGQLPTSSNAWPLSQKIMGQLQAQVPQEAVTDVKPNN